MPFIPHTPTDIAAMLQEIGVDSLDKLFDEIPSDLQIRDLPELPDGLNRGRGGRS